MIPTQATIKHSTEFILIELSFMDLVFIKPFPRKEIESTRVYTTRRLRGPPSKWRSLLSVRVYIHLSFQVLTPTSKPISNVLLLV